jgi:hypothetical protein
MNTNFYRVATVVFLTASVAAVYFGYLSWSEPIQSPSARPVLVWDPAVEFGEAAVELPPKDAGNSQVIVEKPLFSSTRKPFEPPILEPQVAQAEPAPVVQPIQAPTFDPSQFVMKGVLLMNGSWRALIASPETPAGKWLAVGDELFGWRIRGITPNETVVALQQEIRTLQLYVDKDEPALGIGASSQ